jgi:hypothetical protein
MAARTRIGRPGVHFSMILSVMTWMYRPCAVIRSPCSGADEEAPLALVGLPAQVAQR